MAIDRILYNFYEDVLMSFTRILNRLSSAVPVRTIYSGSKTAEIDYWLEMHASISHTHAGSTSSVSKHTKIELHQHGHLFNKHADKIAHGEKLAKPSLPSEHVDDAAPIKKGKPFKAW